MAIDATTRVVSEPTRERETYKYDPSLLTSVRVNDDGLPIPSSELVTSEDTVLTALAQLGACRLNTARSLISLFDKGYQYIVAEATPTMPLAPSLAHEDRQEDLWLCGTAIPRRHGVCEYTLCALDPAQFEDGDDPTKLPLALVADLTADPRFSVKPYCKPGTPARFYAAVPIRTHRGINIGVYCVIHTEPRSDAEWDEASTELMRGISRAIMNHLEARRSSHVHRRHGRMIRGLGSFVDGGETLSGWHHQPRGRELERRTADDSRTTTPKPALFDDQAAAPGSMAPPEADPGEISSEQAPQRQERLQPQVRGDVSPRGATPTPTPGSAAAAQGQAPGQEGLPAPPSSTKPRTIQDIFSRAANILRESINAEGFLFLDANGQTAGAADQDQQSPQESPQSGDASTNETTGTRSPSTISGTSGDDVQLALPAGDRMMSCPVLGFSASESRNQGLEEEAALRTHHGSIQHKFLSKLLRRYPKGKIFNFDDAGELQSSDTSGDERTSTNTSDNVAGKSKKGERRRTTQRRKTPWAKQRNEVTTLLEAFPGARSVAFVSIWDPKKDRWFAGAFAYTYTRTKIFTITGELSYLRAFGMLTIEESFRHETQLADKAKSDVLNSLSHELRSPLHGIVLGVELLNDTQLDVFQGNILHTLETCSRTLLDTVDHLLDFSKVNNYMASMKMRRQAVGVRGLRQGWSSRNIEAGMKSLYSHVVLDVLAEEVMESVFAGFNFQHASLSQLTHRKESMHADAHANRRMDSMRAMEELGPLQTETGELRVGFGRISIFLDVDPSGSWSIHTQPGAVRRIVMNLFGNALKYTRQGTIVVSLKQDRASKRQRSRLRMFKITVADTGKGITEDYLRNRLFRPFAQEDHLAPGAGLGLSLVKQITNQLKGNISVESRVGFGTTVSVSLPLPAASDASGQPQPAENDGEFKQKVSELQGQTVLVVGFDQATQNTDDTRFNNLGLIDRLCRGRFGMSTMTAAESAEAARQSAAPDVVLCMDHSLEEIRQRTDVPVIVVCPNALVSYQRSISANMPKNFEFISQP